jgi:uncharacterized protein YbaA (DUF1428 family)
MAQYVDGYIIPIPKKNLKAYTKMAKMGCKSWMKHGALAYYECYFDDFAQHGLGFKKMCKLKPSETAIFAFIVFKSKAHRDRVNKVVMEEMSCMGFENMKMPFDMKRFAMAGCKVLVKSK